MFALHPGQVDAGNETIVALEQVEQVTRQSLYARSDGTVLAIHRSQACPMTTRPIQTEHWNRASGYVVIVLGIAGAAFERGSPPFTAPIDEVIAFWSTYRRELLAQSLMFVLSAGAYLWFFGALRSVLVQAEGGAGAISTIAFGAGVVAAALQMILQGFQVALAVGASGGLERDLVALFGGLLWALSVIAYVPMGVMLAAVAAVSFAHRAFPRWLAWFSLAASMAHFVMTLGLVVTSGPLVPGQVTTYALYAMALLWLIATTTVMVFQVNRTPQRSR